MPAAGATAAAATVVGVGGACSGWAAGAAAGAAGSAALAAGCEAGSAAGCAAGCAAGAAAGAAAGSEAGAAGSAGASSAAPQATNTRRVKTIEAHIIGQGFQMLYQVILNPPPTQVGDKSLGPDGSRKIGL
ncbi:MAG: hypothetical protein F4X65_14390 [Chloroflexi bacterium]|nr:hypothetical protein [Chloroflexota bacterium]